MSSRSKWMILSVSSQYFLVRSLMTNLKDLNVIQKVINKLVNPVRCYLLTRVGGHECMRDAICVSSICPMQKIILSKQFFFSCLSFSPLCSPLFLKAWYISGIFQDAFGHENNLGIIITVLYILKEMKFTLRIQK